MKTKKIKQAVLRKLGHALLLQIVNILCITLRISKEDKEKIKLLKKSNQNIILAFWHGNMILPWYLFRKNNFAGLTSKSKDGNLLAQILKSWKYNVVRGSSSKGGDVALEIIIDFAKNNHSVAITPDGSQGPFRKMKAGAVIAAKKSGNPLVLMGVGFQNKRVLKNWDKFTIPKFFTKVKIEFSEPIYIDENLEYNETSKVIDKCNNLLNEIQEKAEKYKFN